MDLTDLTEPSTQAVYAGGAIGLILMAVYIQKRRRYVAIPYGGQMLPPIAPQYAGVFNQAMSRPAPPTLTGQLANAYYRAGMPVHAAILQGKSNNDAINAIHTAQAVASAVPTVVNAVSDVATAIGDLTGGTSSTDDGSGTDDGS